MDFRLHAQNTAKGDGEIVKNIIPTKVIPSESVSEQMENDAARMALERAAAGEKLTIAELRAIRVVENRRDSRDRWIHYETIPKKDYREMSGRQAKIINEQANRYGIPIAGRTISLPALLRWLHDFLAEKQHILRRDVDDVAMNADTEAAERYRKAKAGQEEIKLAAMQGRYCDTEQILSGLGIYFGSLRESFHSLQKRVDRAACREIQEAINGAELKAREFLLAHMTKTGSLPPGVEPVKPKRKRKPRKAVKKK